MKNIIQLSMSPDELTHKFIAVLNKKVPVPNLMNGLGHMAAGLVGGSPNLSEMRFAKYVDRDGGDHKSISDFPFIILQADNSNQIRNLRKEALSANIDFVDFTSAMTIGTYLEQRQRMKETLEAELEYYGICMFGSKEILANLTRKFSLWRS